MADLELVSLLEALAASFLDSRKVSTSCASATTGLVGGLTLPSDMVAVGLGFCDGERADYSQRERRVRGCFPSEQTKIWGNGGFRFIGGLGGL